MHAEQTHVAARSPSPRKQPAAKYHASPVVSAILRGPTIQPKLKIGAANDPAEREADAVADKVMRMPAPSTGQGAVVTSPGLATGPNPIRRLCTGCEDEVQRMVTGARGEVDEEELIQPKEKPGATPALSAASEGAIRGLGGGAPLAPSERAFFEPRFGRDFSDVRIHTGTTADTSAKSINARAYTLGSEITFARGEYTPGTSSGRRLLAHELVHAVQQRGTAGPTRRKDDVVSRVPAQVSPRVEDAEVKEQEDESVRRKTAANDQGVVRRMSAPTGTLRHNVHPWGDSVGGTDLKSKTDAGSTVQVWQGYSPLKNQYRYWCHGHSLGTYNQFDYSAYSGSPMKQIVSDEWNIITPSSNAKAGDIMVWVPGHDHSARLTKVTKDTSGNLNPSSTMLSTKNGQDPLTTMSLQQVIVKYRRISRGRPYVYRHK